MLSGGRFTDRPLTVCPVIGAILRAYNDNIDDRRRQDLYRFAAEVVGTRGDFILQARRAAIAIDWAKERYGRQRRARRKGRLEPEVDGGPERIANYVVGSLTRRQSDATHQSMIALLERLLALGPELSMDALVGEFVEEGTQPVEHCGGEEQLLAAEIIERGLEAGLDAGPSLLDQGSSDLGERGHHNAPVAVGAKALDEALGGKSLEHLGDAGGAEVSGERQLAGGHGAAAQAEQQPVLSVAELPVTSDLPPAEPSERGHRPLERATDLRDRIDLPALRRHARSGLRQHLPALVVHAAIASAIVSAVSRD